MKAKKSFGQHFLQDKSVIKKIIEAAEIKGGDSVLEIGPGHGVLTQALVEAGASVTAVEADKELIPELTQTFGQTIKLVYGDILAVDLSFIFEPSKPYKLVANLPYNITSAAIEKFLTAEVQPSKMVIMIQREVADRILAAPGEMGLLSVVCQLYTRGRKVVNVPPGAFRPSPKVDSTVIVLDQVKWDKKAYSREDIIALAKAGFSSRRKQLHHNLAAAKIAASERVKEVLKQIGLPETARAQELSTNQWIECYEALM